MNWETVTIKNESKGRTVPYASVGFGRLSLSVAASELIKDYDKYDFAELLKGKINSKSCVGIRLLYKEERTDNSLPLKRRKSGGKIVGGFDIANKPTLEELFGPTASASKATRYNVKKDPDNENILIVFLK